MERLVASTWATSYALVATMSKVYVFMDTTPVDQTLASNKMEVYCPPTGYFDKSLRRFIDSKQQKRNLLRRAGMRECGERFNPDKMLGGNEGGTRKHGRCRTSWTVGVSSVRPEDV